MGADFIHAVCPLPKVTDDVKKEISLRISALNEASVDEILNAFHHDWETEVEDRVENMLQEKHLFKVDSLRETFKKEIADEMINEAIEEVIYCGSRRDVGHLFLEGRWWAISGGMSWGDAPTDAMRYIDILEVSGILEDLNNKE